ncbi:hypothetical protein Q3H58_001577 [Pseudomonas psychrotolerans]|nr:hypothetical protein [Pseudomonas psychrotolerans]
MVSDAGGLHHLQPGLPRPGQLRFRRRLGHGRRPGHHPGHVVAAGRAVLSRLFLLPGARRHLCREAQRQAADFLEPDRLGRTRHPDRPGAERHLAHRHSLPAGRGRGGGDAGDAGLSLPLVHQAGALAGQHLPDPWQSGDHPLDVGGLGLSDPRAGLALDVHHRRPAGGDLGLHLVARGRRAPQGRQVARSGGEGAPGSRAQGRAAGYEAGEELCRSLPLAQGHPAVAAVFLLEHRRLWLRHLAAVDPAPGRPPGHRPGRLAVGAALPCRRAGHGRRVLGV